MQKTKQYRRLGEAVSSAVLTATAVLLPTLVVVADGDVDVEVDDEVDAIAFDKCFRHVAMCASRTRT